MERKREFLLNWRNDWAQLLGGNNWSDWCLICVEFGDDRIMGAVELTIVLLGLGFNARWRYTLTDEWRDICERADAIQRSLSDG